MNKIVGQRARKNHLLKYFNEHFSSEETEILEDLQNQEYPQMKFQTKSRIITLLTDDYGEVTENFRMRRGAGSKTEFLEKQKAYIELNTYLKLNYPEDAVIKMNSFEEGMIKIQTDTQIITLTFDTNENKVIEKTRNRRRVNTKKEAPTTKQLTEDNSKKQNKKGTVSKTNKKETLTETSQSKQTLKKEKTTQTSINIEDQNIKELIKSKQVKQARHKCLKEGMSVKNIYDGGIYKVLNDDNGMIRVIDNAKITHLMTIADLEVIS